MISQEKNSDPNATFSTAEIAADFGITEEELNEFLVAEGLLHKLPNGTYFPSQKLIDEGLVEFSEVSADE